METFKQLLGKLVKTPDVFTPNDLQQALELLFTPDLVPPVQIGAFLAALHIHKVEQNPENLAAAAQVLRARAIPAPVEDADKDFVVDIVGTGGDGHDTFNVSTTAAIIAAGAGARVVKHGSRASTSSSGSADLLQALDCVFVPPSPDGTSTIPRVPFYFILAPHYHPALALLAPYRKSLPFRTLFNVLGPLINPARPRGMVLGIADPSLGRPFAQSLADGGVERALVVCGKEGLDEISCAGETDAWVVKEDGVVHETVLHPRMFGLGVHALARVKGGDARANAGVLVRLLEGGGGRVADEDVPVCEFVLMNAAALLVVAGLATGYEEGVRLARESIADGRAYRALETFRETGKKAMAARENES